MAYRRYWIRKYCLYLCNKDKEKNDNNGKDNDITSLKESVTKLLLASTSNKLSDYGATFAKNDNENNGNGNGNGSDNSGNGNSDSSNGNSGNNDNSGNDGSNGNSGNNGNSGDKENGNGNGNSQNNGNGNGNGNSGENGKDGNNGNDKENGNSKDKEDKGNNGQNKDKNDKTNNGKHLGWYKNPNNPNYEEGGYDLTNPEIFEVTNYINDLSEPISQVLMTTDVDGNYRGVYTYDNESQERISVEDLGHDEGVPNDPLYYLKDAQGTIASITNMNGEIIDSNRFAPYGEALDPVAKNARLTNSPFGYTGEAHDIEGGLVYLRARYYEPDTMRFIQQDTELGNIKEPLSRNLYAYAQDNPLTYTDPTGHRPDDGYGYANPSVFQQTYTGNDIQQAKYGETSGNVKNIQKVLMEYDYWTDSKSSATGYFGDVTKASLIRFQTGHVMKLGNGDIYKNGKYVGCGPATSSKLSLLKKYLDKYRNEESWRYYYDAYKYIPTAQYGDGANNWNIENTNKAYLDAKEKQLSDIDNKGTGNAAVTSNVTPETIINNLGLGIKNTGVSNWEALKSLATVEGWQNIDVMLTPVYRCSDEELVKKAQMIQNISDSITSGYNEFVSGDWNVKSYYISRIGSEIVLSLVVAKGTQYATKAIKLGKLEEVVGVSGKLDDAIEGTSNTQGGNVVNYAKYKEVLRTTEAANPLVDSLRQTGNLPSNYITKAQAEALGWKPGKALGNYAPGKQIGGDVFENTTGVLPSAQGRVWYEADVGLSNTMTRAKQPGTRLLYSNGSTVCNI